jgi:hypothetical protein
MKVVVRAVWMLVHLRGLRILPQPKANTMKKALILLALWASFAVIAYSQSTPPQTWTELDGSPRVTAPTTIVWPNGSLTVSGKKITVSGTGGSGCTPPGTLSRVLYDDGAGGCTSTSGLTATATTITIVNGVTATFSRAGVLYTGTVTTDNSSVQTMLLQGDRATVASNDEAYVTYRLSNAAGTQTEVARMTWAIPTATAAAENGRLDFSVMTAGALAKELQLAGDDLSPSVSDGLALGTVSLPWSDIFLATGAVIDFANNDSRITHSSGVLTISAGDLRVTTAGTNAASVATLNGTQSFQNKTITNSNNVLGGVTMTLGSDADGDTYYRASNVLTRLPKGTAGQVLTMNAGATAPEWAAGGGSSGLTVGTTTVTSGTGGRLFYETAGNVLGEVSGATSNGTAVTFTSGNLIATSAALTTPAITTSQTTTRDAIGATSTDGIILTNTTAAAAGAQQYSPRLRLHGSGWKTTATAAARDVDWIQEVQPIQGTTAPTANLTFSAQINGGGYTPVFTMTSGNVFGTEGSGTSSPSFGSINNSTYALRSGLKVISDDTYITSNGSNYFRFAGGGGFRLRNDMYLGFSLDSNLNLPDTLMTRGGVAIFRLGNTDAASPVGYTISSQSVVAGTTNTAGATRTEIASLGTSQGTPGRYHIQTGAMIAASGSTQQTAVDRLILGATKVLTNNTVTTVVNVTDASNTVAAGFVEYAVEVFDGTDLQVETGSFTYQVTNKGGTIANNTITFAGASGVGVTSNYPKNTTTSGTLAVTWAISAANPALLSVNANSSLTPSTGYPRVTYTIRNLTQQAVAPQ